MTNDDKEEIKGLKLFGLLFPLGQVQTPTFRSRRTPAQSCKLSNKGAEEVAPSIEVMHSLITNEAYFNSPTPVVGLKYNSTHLWSMRLADENYFQIARLLPCRNVSYSRGSKIDQINSCDHSTTNEYSIENTLKAQQWIFEHQHPSDCSNKRFAIIVSYSESGFGSSFHQIAWAFGKALGDNRIAIYRSPGGWVN